MEIITKIDKYLSQYIGDPYHRYRSWDICNQAFNVGKNNQNHTLELAFFLSSWGMYRGSSGLLQKNHLIHSGAIDILFSEKNLQLKCNSHHEINTDNIDDILDLKTELANYYRNVGLENATKITPTDTLLSKIMLGTLACVPAYDRYFIEGLKEVGLNHFTFNRNSLNELFNLLKPEEILEAQKHIFDKLKVHYPMMKIIDMFLWQTGFDKATE